MQTQTLIYCQSILSGPLPARVWWKHLSVQHTLVQAQLVTPQVCCYVFVCQLTGSLQYLSMSCDLIIKECILTMVGSCFLFFLSLENKLSYIQRCSTRPLKFFIYYIILPKLNYWNEKLVTVHGAPAFFPPLITSFHTAITKSFTLHDKMMTFPHDALLASHKFHR